MKNNLWYVVFFYFSFEISLFFFFWTVGYEDISHFYIEFLELFWEKEVSLDSRLLNNGDENVISFENFLKKYVLDYGLSLNLNVVLYSLRSFPYLFSFIL